MTTTIEVGATGVPLLPTDPPRFGPVTRVLLRRFIAAIAVIELIGTVLVVVGDGRVRAAGLSIVFPGGGLWYAASPETFAVVAVLFLLAFILWWGISAHFAIPAVWGLGVVLSAVLGDGGGLFTSDGTTWPWAIGLVYALALGAATSVVVWSERKYRRKLAAVPALNDYLDRAVLPRGPKPTLVPDDHDAAALTWVYDMALQPLDEFVGFDWGEQIHGPTCVRYQIDFLGWSLAAYAANHLPNAPQPVERAMRNLIEKLTDLRVWQYWRTMNLIGNFDPNPDPIIRDNIMLSAYTLNLINVYEAVTGSTHFDQPGSLTFVWSDGRTFAYDHHRLADVVRDNYQQSRLGFFPCEPGWAFTACNTIGAEGLFGYDTVHGAKHWAGLRDRWRRTALEEYVQPDGLFPHIKSTKIGLSFDTGEVDQGEYPSTGLNGFADIAPDLAARAAALSLRGADDRMAAMQSTMVDGALPLELPLTRERNIPFMTAVPAWTRVIGGARAVGRHELAAAAREAMWRQCATGERWPARPLRAGVQNTAIHLMMAWSTPINLAELNRRGYVAPTGPVLGETPWPDVLVTEARSSDGRSLDLAMRPGRNRPIEVLELRFTRLEPGVRYALGDRHVVADTAGEGVVTIDLAGPATMRLEPVAAP